MLRKTILTFAVSLLSLVAGVAIGAPVLSAQNNMSAQSGNDSEALERLQKMSAALNLTPAQKKQVRPILMEEAPKLKELKSNTSLGPMQKAMQMRQIAEQTDAKLKPILTPQQYQTWQQMREQERQQMMQKMESH